MMESLHIIRKVPASWLQGIVVVFAASLILSIAAAQVLLGLITVIVLWNWRHFRSIRLDWVEIALLVFIAIRMASIAFSIQPEISLRVLYTEIPMFMSFFVLRRILSIEMEDSSRTILWALLASGLAAALWGGGRVLLGIIPRAMSFSSGYYTLGTYLTALLGFVLIVGREPRIFPIRYVWQGITALLLFGIILTMNRIHWGIAALLIVGVGIVRERRLLAGAAVMAVLAVVLVPSVGARFEQFIHFASNLSDRDWLWKGAMMRAGEHPWLGFGPGTFREVFPLHSMLADQGISGWHNDYLQIFMESGLLGLGAFLCFIGAVVWKGMRDLRESVNDSYRRRMTLGILTAFGTVLLSALSGRAALDLLIVLLYGLLAALLAPSAVNRMPTVR